MFKFVIILAIIGLLAFGVFQVSDIGDFINDIGGIEVKSEVSVGGERE